VLVPERGATGDDDFVGTRVTRGEAGGESRSVERVAGERRVAALSRSEPVGDGWRRCIELFEWFVQNSASGKR
jgi:hypothetical protein